MIKILLFFIIFTTVVLVHELGHFLLGKKNGIGVVEFSMGLGPTLFGFTKGGTKYSLKLLPFGGACMFEGEDAADESPSAFNNAKVGSRIATVVAGPLFNFLLAFLLALFMVGAVGFDEPVIGTVMEQSGAAEAGLQEGDRIVSLNGSRTFVYREIVLYSRMHQGETTEVVYERGGERYTSVIEPKYDEEAGMYYLGFVAPEQTYQKGTALQTLQYGFYEVIYWIRTTIKSLGMLITGKVTVADLSGPVGVAQVVGEVYEASRSYGWFAVLIEMLNISILLSANLGVMNLLPLPALDGGRLVFLIVEAVRGKRVDPEKEGMVHFVGLVLLMLLMVFVMYNDIRKLF